MEKSTQRCWHILKESRNHYSIIDGVEAKQQNFKLGHQLRFMGSCDAIFSTWKNQLQSILVAIKITQLRSVTSLRVVKSRISNEDQNSPKQFATYTNLVPNYEPISQSLLQPIKNVTDAKKYTIHRNDIMAKYRQSIYSNIDVNLY